jgi:cellulose synthase operon protein B
MLQFFLQPMRFFATILAFLLLAFSACKKNEQLEKYTASGKVVNSFGTGIAHVKVYRNSSDFVLSDSLGSFAFADLSGATTLYASDTSYSFIPATINIDGTSTELRFVAQPVFSSNESQIINWLNNVQLPNGLLENTENSNTVSLYDNALASMVFMLNGDFERAEKIFDFFNGRLNSELLNGNGGFFQFRNSNGYPMGNRWMGDNAWLLIALNNYKASTGNTQYDVMAEELSNWIMSLQDLDGGLFAGYTVNNVLLNYKVTEGNIDAFNAIEGYTTFHSNLLNYLEANRWSETDNNLVSWPDNPTYLYALDNHSWSYCIFPNYPVSALTSAIRFQNTKTVTLTNEQITGYDIDEDKDMVWLEGTGQMALAYKLAGMHTEASFYLSEMEKAFVSSAIHSNSFGFPYASNAGTGYGSDPLWAGADTEIAISGGAWYLFAQNGFNPFEVGTLKSIPSEDMFWLP